MKSIIFLFFVFCSINLNSAEMYSCKTIPGEEVGEEMKFQKLLRIDLNKKSTDSLKHKLERIDDNEKKLPELGKKIFDAIFIDAQKIRLLTFVKRNNEFYVISSDLKSSKEDNQYILNDKDTFMFSLSRIEFMGIQNDYKSSQKFNN